MRKNHPSISKKCSIRILEKVKRRNRTKRIRKLSGIEIAWVIPKLLPRKSRIQGMIWKSFGIGICKLNPSIPNKINNFRLLIEALESSSTEIPTIAAKGSTKQLEIPICSIHKDKKTNTWKDYSTQKTEQPSSSTTSSKPDTAKEQTPALQILPEWQTSLPSCK